MSKIQFISFLLTLSNFSAISQELQLNGVEVKPNTLFLVPTSVLGDQFIQQYRTDNYFDPKEKEYHVKNHLIKVGVLVNAYSSNGKSATIFR